MTTISPIMLAAAGSAILLPFAILLFGKFRSSRRFRDYEDIANDLRGIARRLKQPAIVRDKDDILITGQLESVPLSVRFSHCESTPGVYIRCAAEADFSLTFAARTPADADAPDLCRTGDSVFDMRFAGKTDNRVRAKQIFTQSGCHEHLQRLCCSNKTMFRLSSDAIELSEALIPSDTERHVISHLESVIVLKAQLTAIRAPIRGAGDVATVRNFPLVARIAIAAAAAVVAVGLFMWKSTPETVDATSPVDVTQGGLAKEGVVIPNPNGWTQANVADLDPEFVAWLKNSGGTPETRIVLDAHGDGGSTSVAYILRAKDGEKMKRVVWVVGDSVVCDFVGRIEGLARIPKENMAKISWAEGAAPTVPSDGDGLLVIRDHTKAGTATVYFTGERVLHTAMPADFHDVSVL